MSFNVRYGTADDGINSWPHRRESCIDAIRMFKPDILGVQEALAFQVEELRDGLGLDSIGVGRDDGTSAGEFAAIFFDPIRLRHLRNGTFWFSTTPDVPGSKFPGCYHPRICTWAEFAFDGETIRACNLHLDNESEAARNESVRQLLATLAADVPMLVLGDFNAGEGDACIEEMRVAGWRDSFRVLHPTDVVSTYHGFGSLLGDKIDTIWVDRTWQVADAAIVQTRPFGTWPSDHYPVTAVVRL